MNRQRRDRWFLGASAGVLVVAAVLGFLRLGSPVAQRRFAEDRQRVRDLMRICGAIKEWHDRNPAAELPESLEAVQAASLSVVVIRDPVTGKGYTYTKTGGKMYRLCAEFNEASDAAQEGGERLWRHSAGSHCYDLNASRGQWEMGFY
ncbi:MAG: hypothetical protein SFV54_00595 [Bryobacteraceae bacterium]|nr:hypothetical protein [Bryobacteraceae bacterium]